MTARPRKPLRQPTTPATQASGVAAAKVRMFEAANTEDSGVDSLLASNQRAHRNTTDMKEAAQPMPTTTRPAIRPPASAAWAIHAEPTAASSDTVATVRRAPKRANHRPTVSWPSNKAKKKSRPAH